MSLRGGELLFSPGEDLSVGDERHDEELVQLCLEKSLSFRIVSPIAAVVLHP